MFGYMYEYRYIIHRFVRKTGTPPGRPEAGYTTIKVSVPFRGKDADRDGEKMNTGKRGLNGSDSRNITVMKKIKGGAGL